MLANEEAGDATVDPAVPTTIVTSMVFTLAAVAVSVVEPPPTCSNGDAITVNT